MQVSLLLFRIFNLVLYGYLVYKLRKAKGAANLV